MGHNPWAQATWIHILLRVIEIELYHELLCFLSLQPQVTVTTDNMREYIDAVVDATLGSGVSAQVYWVIYLFNLMSEYIYAVVDATLGAGVSAQVCSAFFEIDVRARV